MADALAPLPVPRPPVPGRRRDATYWRRQHDQLLRAARTLLLAPLSPEQRAALLGTTLTLTDLEEQIIRAYRALTVEDRQAIRRLLSAFSGIDVARRDKRDKLAARRRQTMTRATNGNT